MEPDISDKSIALVKSCETVPNAHIGIVWYKGDCYCKKIIQNNNRVLLVSTNKEYRPIEVTSYDEFHIFGEVLETIVINERQEGEELDLTVVYNEH